MAEEKASDKHAPAQAAPQRNAASPKELAARASRLDDENVRLRSMIRELEMEAREQTLTRGIEVGDLTREAKELETENEALRRQLRQLEDQLNLKPSLPLRRNEERGGREGRDTRQVVARSAGGNGQRNEPDDLFARVGALCRCL